MSLTVQLAPVPQLPAVTYRWDADTESLSASVGPPPRGAGGDGAHAAVREALGGAGPSGAIEVEGTDGSWLSLELVHGRIGGVQVAVWPTVRRRSAIAPPLAAPACAAYARAPGAAGRAGAPVAVELPARVLAETDAARRHFRFAFGPPRPVTTARIARDVLLELDDRQRLAGLWLLNVPPAPDPVLHPHDT